MVQAAARNGIDFGTALTRDRYWWLKARWILDQIEAENSIEIYRLQHAQHLAVLDYTLPSQQTFDGHWEGANKSLTQIFSTRFPWLSDVKTSSRRSDIDSLLAKWKAKYGDIRDPKVYEKYANIAKRWMAQTDKAKKNQFQDQRKLGTVLNKLNKKYKARNRRK